MDIRLSKIEVRFPSAQKPLFRIPEFSIPAKSRTLITGPSGKGKTTLLHLIAGLYRPVEGYVYLDDQNLSFMSDDQRSRLRFEKFGIVFQKLNLIDFLTARENIQLAPRASPRVDGVLKQLGIENVSETRASLLSLGEQQRVAVARVLVSRPEVILADEPSSSLDEVNAHSVIDALLDAGKDATVLVVSHDQRIQKKFKNVISFSDLVNA